MKNKILLLYFIFYLTSGYAASTWDSLSFPGDTLKMCSFFDQNNSLLYFTSLISDTNGNIISRVNIYDGDSIITLSDQFHGFIYSMIIYNDNLVVGGQFDSINNDPVIDLAFYHNNSFSPIEIPEASTSNAVLCFANYNNYLYIGGTFNNRKSILQFDSNNIEQLEESPNGMVNSMCVFDSKLYVGGSFDSINGLFCQNIGKWDGTNWYNVQNGLSGAILSMANYDSKLYVGGCFNNNSSDTSNYIFSIAYLENDEWNKLNLGVFGCIMTMSIYKQELYIGGSFDVVNGAEIYNIARWNGSDWFSCDAGITGIEDDSFVSSFNVFGNSLFIFGKFDSANGVNCNNIIKYQN